MKKTLLFCTGLSGTGKTYFIKHTLPAGLFYNLKSATTRPMREGESEGNPYFFHTEESFSKLQLVTNLFVNESIWQAGMPKWLYGVPESEVLNHLDNNLTYDVIQPKYIRQMIDWFCHAGLNKYYNFKIAYFIGPDKCFDVVKQRANMPNDLQVRTMNTCSPNDFIDAGLDIDYLCRAKENQISTKLQKHIKYLQQHTK